MLINETQWVGIIVKPIDYSLTGGVLHIDTGPGLDVDESHVIEMEKCKTAPKSVADMGESNPRDVSSSQSEEITQITLQNGQIQFPEWASDVTSVLWVPVRAIGDGISRGIKLNSSLDLKFQETAL